MKISLLLLTVVSINAVYGQQSAGRDTVSQVNADSMRVYTTSRLAGTPPTIDGRLDDPAWEQVPWGGDGFRQVSPNKGKPATVQTRFKILYDAKNLYVAVKCLDPEPGKIVKRMARRDSFEGDWVEINIDSYYDKRTAFSFTASVSGVKGDEYVSNNGDNWDAGWDPIWYLKTSIDAEGWNAEFRIPLSQLRFTNKEELVWGLQLTRIYFRQQERSVWKYIPPDAGGWVHLFGELRGIKGIKPQKQLEVQPFIVGQTESFQSEEGNPYRTGSQSHLNAGLDAKIGITSDITLDLTVNPDFGQVEADPSQVNLSAFRLFFQERRPFFTEGNNTLDFPVGQIDNNNLFYSRRIGRPPQVGVNTDQSGQDDVREWVKPNFHTTILGAAKLTGKNKKGFSWGILESVTEKETAEVDSIGFRRRVATEPLTNYFVARAQQDINKGNTVAGAMFTAVNRRLDEPQFDWLHRSAYSGGIDILHHWKRRTYYVSARSVFSHVKGSTEAISETQLASERFFQRPDNKHKEFDPTRTSLTGTGGQFLIGKKSGDIVADLGVLWQSPEFEINDIGFLSQTDNINQWFWMQYRVLEPKGISRVQRYNINQWRNYDFGGRLTSEGYNLNAHTQLKNFWAAGTGVTWQRQSVSNADLRGGPSIRYPGGKYLWGYIRSDTRKKVYGEIYTEFFLGDHDYSNVQDYGLDLVFQPMNALNLTISGWLTKNNNEMQWVASPHDGTKHHYVVGEIDQTVARLAIRMTYMVTPDLSIQYWGQPFGSSGRYGNYKSITNSRAGGYRGRFSELTHDVMTRDENGFNIDANGDGMRDYGFSNPDFNFGQFRSNLVIRWEYIPGSTLFLVWTQERNGAFYADDPGHRRYSFDFDEKAYNIFLIKYTYRFIF